MSSLEIEDEELTMRIFPMPLSGEKKKMGKIEGGEALLIDKFSRVLFSIGICRENFLFVVTYYFLLLAFGLYTQMLHKTMTKKHRSDLINYNIYYTTLVNCYMIYFIHLCISLYEYTRTK